MRESRHAEGPVGCQSKETESKRAQERNSRSALLAPGGETCQLTPDFLFYQDLWKKGPCRWVLLELGREDRSKPLLLRRRAGKTLRRETEWRHPVGKEKSSYGTTASYRDDSFFATPTGSMVELFKLALSFRCVRDI